MNTPLHELHVSLHAKMVPYAGWDMPGYYTSPVLETQAVRNGAGVFDVSHMGEFRISGPSAESFLQYVTTNDAGSLANGSAQYSMLLNHEGGVIDDVIVYRFDENDFLVVVNAGCAEKDLQWLTRLKESFPDVTIVDESLQTALIAVQGPIAVTLVQKLCGEVTIFPSRFAFSHANIGGARVTLSRTGYTGDDGYEIFCRSEDARMIWTKLVECNAVPCGLVARDILRTEAAYPLYGHELSDDVSPWSSGTSWAVKTSKGDFVGRQAYLNARTGSKKLIGLQVKEKAIPRQGCVVESAEEDGDPIGVVTSGTLSPTVGVGIAIARVDRSYSKLGISLNMDVRGRKVECTVVQLPFYRNGV